MCMLDEQRAKRYAIYAIARQHKAERLWVFGACTRKEALMRDARSITSNFAASRGGGGIFAGLR